MAEDEGSQEKTEEPSEKKIRDALEEGKVLTSKELMLSVVMLTGFLQIMFGGRYYFEEFTGGFRSGLNIKDIVLYDAPLLSVVGDRFMGILKPIILFSGPIFL